MHEYNRPLAANKSSYDSWQSGVKLYKNLCEECGKSPVISSIQTTTKKSLNFPKEIINEYLSNGINRLYIRPLTPLGCAYERWNIIGCTPEEYIKFYCEIFDYMLELCKTGKYIVEVTASIYLARILNNESVDHTEFRSPCGAGVGQMAVNYDGNIYTCDEGRMLANMGDNAFKIGSVNNTYQELLKSPVVHATCAASCIESLPKCHDCVYSPYCSVCPVINYGLEHDLISRNVNDYKCVISKGILDHLFTILQRNLPEEINILRQWAND